MMDKKVKGILLLHYIFGVVAISSVIWVNNTTISMTKNFDPEWIPYIGMVIGIAMMYCVILLPMTIRVLRKKTPEKIERLYENLKNQNKKEFTFKEVVKLNRDMCVEDILEGLIYLEKKEYIEYENGWIYLR